VQLPVLLKYQLIVSQIKFIICYCNINCFSNKEIVLYSEDINCIIYSISKKKLHKMNHIHRQSIIFRKY
jgi:hypothetical protein